jgi:hypothetical protein
MAKIKIEIEFPEFVTAMLNDCEYTPEQSVKILKAFVQGKLAMQEGYWLETDLFEFLDDIAESGEEEEILNS